MSDFAIFIIGSGVTAVVGCAVGLLVWGAAQERYMRGTHVGEDLLRAAEGTLRVDGPAHPRGRVLPGGKASGRRTAATRRVV